MQPNADGKTSPGSPFKPPAARIWNNMVEAGKAYSDSRLNNEAPNPIRPRETDIIKAKNTSGAARRLGEILRIDGKAIETVTDENKWLLGVEPTEDGYFGILKEPVAINGIAELQVSGCSMALVNVTSQYHRFARSLAGAYVLDSAYAGQIEILFAPDIAAEDEYPQELTCVVRFGCRSQLQVILTADLLAAVNSKRDPGTATARILRRRSNGDLTLSADEITVTNRFMNISLDIGTYVKVEWIDGEWQPYAADCPGGSDSENV
jgi:hypothetical protein